jgi:small-conductance mechanosensitive channel
MNLSLARISTPERFAAKDERPTSSFAGSRLRLLFLAPAILVNVIGVAVSQTPPVAGPSPGAIIRFLEQTIDWYRQLDVEKRLTTEPKDLLLVSDNQQMADQVVRLAFDYARAEAESLEKQPGPNQEENQGSNSSRYQALLRLSSALDRQIRETRAEVESLQQKLSSTTGRQRQTLQTKIAETQSELELAAARKDSLLGMVEFVAGSSTNGLGATGLRAKIEALARSVPAALTKPSSGKERATAANEPIYPAAAVPTRNPEPSGVWGLGVDLIALSRKNQPFDHLIQLTDSLAQAANEHRAPLVNKLREMSKRGDDLASQADSADQTTLGQEKKELDALAVRFKLTSAAVLPLSKQGVLLDLYKQNLTNWQKSVRDQFTAELRNLLIRLAGLIVFLAVIIGAAGLWRRTVFRYVQDVRRRHQLLLLRRIVLWCTIASILVFTFANEIGSVATFAGLMTAGVAVALQSVILSVAGYFFLVGRFGIRVGDRVHVAGVTGEVVDIGLVRFHMLELVSGGDKIPTGRVVAFPNSIVFQSTAGLFKQIPGTNFVWHEITLSLSSNADRGFAEERLRATVDKVFSEYREEMDRQYRQIDKTLMAVPEGELQPRIRLRLTQSGFEAVIRYPVDLQHAGEIDDRLTRELFDAIEREPELKLAGSTTSRVKLRTDLTAADVTPR